MEPEELFRRERGPVVLPSEEGQHRQRGLLTWVAVLIVVVGAAAGLTHHLLWQDVGSEVTRILPASTGAYAEAARPWANLERAMELDRWADPAGLDHARLTQGLLADGLGGRIAAIPLNLVRRTLLVSDRVRTATVPTAEGTAWILFARIGDPWAHRRLVGHLAPHLETVDRVMGYAVQTLRPHTRRLPWLEPPPPLRIVFMDDQVVVGFGPPEAMEDLVQARVTGRSQPLARHEGFRVVSREEPATGLWAWLDPTTVADVTRSFLEPLMEDPLRLRLALIERVRALRLDSTVAGEDDHLEVRVLARPTEEEEAGDELPPAAPAFAGRPHTLLRRLPFEPAAAVSVSVDDPAAALQAAVEQVTEAAGMIHLRGRPERLVEIRARLVAAGGTATVARALSGEAVLAFPRGPEADPWLLMLGVVEPERGAEAVRTLVRSALGPGWAHGTLYGEGAPLHVARPAETPDAAAPLAWTVRGDVAWVAPGPAALPDAGAGVPADAEAALEQATRALPPDAPLVALATPAVLAPLAPAWLDLVLERLRPGFRLAVAAWAEPGALVLRANVGFWSVAAAVSSLDRLAVHTLALSDLPDACVDAWRDLCATQPETFLCEPLEPGRKDLLRRACDRLGVSAPRR